MSVLQVISRDAKPSVFRNRSNSIIVSRCFELFLKAGVDLDLFQEGFELLFCHGYWESLSVVAIMP
ncbi:hypothetical protein SynBIOSE41_03949 [Synechococcus sp. BIOS-E4-1]|nr:hypothetical protein SynBIOSE41_03949 [Synechococcus sp. BIOS-E4-1]